MSDEWKSDDKEINDDEEFECGVEENIPTLQEIADMLNQLQFVVEEIREKVSTEDYQRKIKTTNAMIQILNDLDEKVTDNMNRLNQMLLKLKGVVSVALGNLSS